MTQLIKKQHPDRDYGHCLDCGQPYYFKPIGEYGDDFRNLYKRLTGHEFNYCFHCDNCDDGGFIIDSKNWFHFPKEA